MPAKRYFEDFPANFIFDFEVAAITPDEIVSFARIYDPQRFHLSEEEAAKTHFGGLVASGFQTQLHCFRPFCENVLLDTWAVGAPGIESLKWLRPWYPGEKLAGSVQLVDKRVSEKKSDRGYVSFTMDASCHGELTLQMDWTVIILTRDKKD